MKKKFEALKSSFAIGDSALGTTAWMSEMDSEFTSKLGLDISKHDPAAQRPRLSTPRSLKRGFVAVWDYEKLMNKARQADMHAEESRLQLMLASEVKETWKGEEEALMRSIQAEHKLQAEATHQLLAAIETLSRLEEQSSLSKALMGEMSSTHGIIAARNAGQTISKPDGSAQKSERITVVSDLLQERKLKAMEGEIQRLSQTIQEMSSKQANTARRPASARSPYKDRAETYRRRTELDLCHWKP